MSRTRVQPGRSTPAPGRARDHRGQTAVLQLQRAAGNAATTRLIGAARRSIARFGEPEHVVKPLNSGDVKTIRAWIRAVAVPRPAPRSDPRQDLVDVMTGMH